MARREQDGVIGVVQANAASLLKLAQLHSLCDDDAADAYQRTLEIYLQRLDQVAPGTAGSWLRTVCKHEAMRIRAARQRVLPPDPVEWDLRPSVEARDAEERATSLERVAQAAEALRGCRPDEATAMLLRADGSSYAEISEACGWSYSKVNRCLATGRARFLARFARIESGEACATYRPTLSAIVDGEATPDDFLAVRPHLRHCAACRATLRALYETEPAMAEQVRVMTSATPDGKRSGPRTPLGVMSDEVPARHPPPAAPQRQCLR
jgi:DNA-directed RNA polymerase specialized sigma24 family protein